MNTHIRRFQKMKESWVERGKHMVLTSNIYKLQVTALNGR